jgi:hypothetical protein
VSRRFGVHGPGPLRLLPHLFSVYSEIFETHFHIAFVCISSLFLWECCGQALGCSPEAFGGLLESYHLFLTKLTDTTCADVRRRPLHVPVCLARTQKAREGQQGVWPPVGAESTIFARRVWLTLVLNGASRLGLSSTR